MANFSMYEIIDKKKNGSELSKEEISWVIKSLTTKKIHDYQMSALLMAIFLKGMTTSETAALTDAMLYSGKTLNFDDPTIIDKHSTGGIGDKASFILAPIAAACGVKVPMIAGRGLGFTGGTVDKVESIKGFKTDLNLKAFGELLSNNGQVLIGQTTEIAPADRIIYALRDVTATIDSIPLITASIMSKKLAEGANGVVMDIKVGSGAFMKNKTEARKLAKSIINTAKRFNKGSVALLTNMDQPLGDSVGNSLEIIESVETLKGKGPKDLTEISLALAARMVMLAGIEKSYNKALAKAKKTISDGSALKKFQELIKAQGGQTQFIKDYNKLPVATQRFEVRAPKAAYIKSFKCDEIGLLCTELGGGRKLKTDKVDFGVGFVFHKKLSDKVKKDESIFTIYFNKGQEKIVEKIEERFFKDVVKFTTVKPKKPDTIFEVIDIK